MASIEKELLQIHDMKMEVDVYVNRLPDNLYGAKLKNLYERPDVETAAREIANMLYYTDPLPQETKPLEQLLAGTSISSRIFRNLPIKEPCMLPTCIAGGPGSTGIKAWKKDNAG